MEDLGKKEKTEINIRTITMYVVLAVLWIIFTCLTSSNFTDFQSSFISPRNLSNLLRQMSVIGIMACGMVLVIVTGGIDLAQGSVMGFLGCVAAALQVWHGMDTAQVILIVILLGIAIGFLQGAIIAYTGVVAFIVTLGGQLVFRGGILKVTNGTTIAPLKDSLLFFGQAYVSKTGTTVIAVAAILLLLLNELKRRSDKRKYNILTETTAKMLLRWILYSVGVIIVLLVLNSYHGLPVPVLILLLCVLAYTFIAEKTTYGRSLYAIGGNLEAAKYAGINVKRNLTIVYCLNGIMAGIAGIVLAARLNAGTTSAGLNMELDSIAAAVIGGTSMTGGVGKVAGAIIGALIMGTIDNGMSMMNLDAYYQYIVKGLILVAAVWFDVWTQTRKAK